MIAVNQFLNCLKEKGVFFLSGVPCSILKPVIRHIIADPDFHYVNAVRENAALGVASGAYLAGTKSAIFIQNSGLGNIINALTSFNLIYKIPVLMFITWRGYQGKDAPEHIIMGEKMLPLLDFIEIPYRVLGQQYKRDIAWAISTIKANSVPVALILKKGMIE